MLQEIIQETKVCNTCNNKLDISEFNLVKRINKSGNLTTTTRNRCRRCQKIISKQHREKPEVKLYKKHKLNDDIRYKIQDRIAAWRKKTPNSNLTVDYLVNIWKSQNGLCYYTGIPMNRKSKGLDQFGMSIDKLDPNTGYMQGNVVFCCYIVNTMKLNRTEQEFYDFMKEILIYRKQLNPDVCFKKGF